MRPRHPVADRLDQPAIWPDRLLRCGIDLGRFIKARGSDHLEPLRMLGVDELVDDAITALSGVLRRHPTIPSCPLT